VSRPVLLRRRPWWIVLAALALGLDPGSVSTAGRSLPGALQAAPIPPGLGELPIERPPRTFDPGEPPPAVPGPVPGPAPPPAPAPSPAPPPAPGAPPPTPGGTPACPAPPPPAAVCSDPRALSAAEARELAVAAAEAVGSPDLAVVVADRLGRPLARYRRGAAGQGELERALGLARTGAFFSNAQAPLSSRTVRFVSGIHFPPGVARTPNAALYGIENTNRGCDLNADFACGLDVPPARSLAGIDAGAPCRSGAAPGLTAGCGAGPVTGKVQPDDAGGASGPGREPVDPGGLPVYKGRSLVGGIGVAGVPGPAAEFAAFQAVAATGSLPDLDALAPGVVFIDGIRLPFVEQLEPPPGVASPGPPVAPADVTSLRDGRCAPDGYLVEPRAGSVLTRAEVERLVRQSVAAAERTRAVIRLPLGSRARMVIAVGDLDGTLLALYRMPDATVFSIDVAVAKARNVIWFSGAGAADLHPRLAAHAVSNRTISFGAQPLFPPGIDGSGEGPFFRGLFVEDLARVCSQGSQPPNPNQNGVVFFPGSMPLYDAGGNLVGGLGISGDGVEQDDYVAFRGAEGFLPDESIWADRVKLQGVRLPFLKFPRNPER